MDPLYPLRSVTTSPHHVFLLFETQRDIADAFQKEKGTAHDAKTVCGVYSGTREDMDMPDMLQHV